MSANFINGQCSVTTNPSHSIVSSGDKSSEGQHETTAELQVTEQHDATHSWKLLKHRKSILSTICAILGCVSLGSIFLYPSLAILDLNSGKSPFHLNMQEISWATSLSVLGGLFGAPFAGLLLDRYGRKLAIIAILAPFAMSWALIIVSQNIYTFCLGRFFTGLCGSVVDVGTTVYISEIAPPEMRGFLGIFHEVGTTFGLILVAAVSPFLRWNWLAIFCQSISVIHLFAMLWVPETPRWLLSKSLKQEAQDSLNWLRDGDRVNALAELSKIEEDIALFDSKPKWREFRQPNLYRPLLISIGLFFLQSFAGCTSMAMYLAEILMSSGSTWSLPVQVLVVAVVCFVTHLLSAFLVDRVGRRVLLMISSLGMTIGVGALAAFFTTKDYTTTLSMRLSSWLPLTSLVFYYFSASLGLSPIPFLIYGELLPLRVRGLAGGVVVSTYYAFSFLNALIFPYVQVGIGNGGSFWVFAGFSALSFLFAFFFVPETKGKVLEDIKC